MPGKRSPNQINITAWVDSTLREAIESGRKRLKLDRSQFLRDAIKEKLLSLNILVPEESTIPPDRVRATLRLNEVGGNNTGIMVAQSGKKNMSGVPYVSGKKALKKKVKKI